MNEADQAEGEAAATWLYSEIEKLLNEREAVSPACAIGYLTGVAQALGALLARVEKQAVFLEGAEYLPEWVANHLIDGIDAEVCAWVEQGESKDSFRGLRATRARLVLVMGSKRGDSCPW